MNGTILDKIIQRKREDLVGAKGKCSLDRLRGQIGDSSPVRDLKAALTAALTSIKIIAEVKKASPSKGIIREDFDPVEIGKIYETNGATAISVLTEEHFFHGSLDHLKRIREVAAIPLLCKDFIIDEYQVYQARVFGADAFLLIAAILGDNELHDLLKAGRELGMEAVVEVHDRQELSRVLKTEAEIIGLNNRDLKTFKTDITTTTRLAKEIPRDRIVISESGIGSRAEILKLKKNGIDAFLIGESLMREKNIAKKLTELLSVQ
ncbi:MAG: indole-3-glycerol phosphate synthase TrpC [Pseudomonadota bacterium]